MTKDKSMPVCCPACLEEGTFRICDFWDTADTPDIKERIFSRDIFRYRCSECGEEILVAYDCTYLDRDSGSIIMLVTDKSDDTIIETTEYNLRVVRSINDFVEKIALIEDNVDDRIVELYKIMLEDQFEDERPGAKILGIYYGGKDEDGKNLVFFIITENAQNCRAMLSFDVYDSISRQFGESAEKFDATSEINRDWAIGVLQNTFSDNQK